MFTLISNYSVWECHKLIDELLLSLFTLKAVTSNSGPQAAQQPSFQSTPAAAVTGAIGTALLKPTLFEKCQGLTAALADHANIKVRFTIIFIVHICIGLCVWYNRAGVPGFLLLIYPLVVLSCRKRCTSFWKIELIDGSLWFSSTNNVCVLVECVTQF